MLLFQFPIQLKVTVCSGFSNCPDTRKNGEKDGMLKQITLITQRFISLQSRPEADMVDLFKHENQREPLLYSTVVCLEREIS